MIEKVVDLWYDVKSYGSTFIWAVRNGAFEFVRTLYPDFAWKRIRTRQFPVIRFPPKIVFEEIEDNGHIGLTVTFPPSYSVNLLFPKDSLDPRRRSFVHALYLLAEFAEDDQIQFDEIDIHFKFDTSLEEKEEAFMVVDSEKLREDSDAVK